MAENQKPPQVKCIFNMPNKNNNPSILPRLKPINKNQRKKNTFKTAKIFVKNKIILNNGATLEALHL
ncbi:MAG: hypothetical protein D8M58_00010 [Calditrichaeota bacterium]|nr:MAG: hypothetical protein DWQ03_07070 [Calditrichota bacterium]MBL1203752.1 hypothetical protein [Calditrichota bacterium]